MMFYVLGTLCYCRSCKVFVFMAITIITQLNIFIFSIGEVTALHRNANGEMFLRRNDNDEAVAAIVPRPKSRNSIRKSIEIEKYALHYILVLAKSVIHLHKT